MSNFPSVSVNFAKAIPRRQGALIADPGGVEEGCGEVLEEWGGEWGKGGRVERGVASSSSSSGALDP